VPGGHVEFCALKRGANFFITVAVGLVGFFSIRWLIGA
jgi:hypothetical protein